MKGMKGFSTVEALIAASVIAVGLLAIASMFPIAYGNVDQSGEQTVAISLALQRIELLKNQSYASLASGTTTESSIVGYTGYTRTTTIQDNTPTTGMKQVTVTVTTPTAGRSVQLMSLMAK